MKFATTLKSLSITSSAMKATVVSIALLSFTAASSASQARSFAPEGFKSTIVVSPVGDASANGNALYGAVEQAKPDSDQPLQIWIEPGVYDLGDKSLTLKPYLSIQGSGIGATVIQGSAQDINTFDLTRGLVIGSDHSSLRGLTLRCLPDEALGQGACIHIVNSGASPDLGELSIESNGYGSHWGIRNTFSSPNVENVKISMHGSLNNYGIVSSLSSYPTIRRAEVTAADGQMHNSGIFNRDGGLPTVIDDTEIFAAGGQEAFGIYNYNASGNGGTLEVVDSLIVARNAQDNGAVRDGSIRLHAESSNFEAGTPGSAIFLSHSGEMDIRDSELTGSDILAFGSDVRLGSVRLSGEGTVEAAQTLSCAAIFTLSPTAQFFESSCPTGGQGVTASTTRVKLRPHPWSEQAH